jgi:hypothetical protein
LGCLRDRLVSKLNRRRNRNHKQSRIKPNLLRLALNRRRPNNTLPLQPLNSNSGLKTACPLLSK